MSIEIKSRYDGRVLYTAKNASDVRRALEEAVKASADLRGADLSGAYLRGADLSGADLRSAYLSGADLRSADLRSADLRSAYLGGAYLSGADLRSADLRSADLRSADLRSAYLSGADLSGADLRSADGLAPEVCNDLLILLDQPGKIRAYKLVNERGEGPQYGGIEYKAGETVEVPEANTNPDIQCAAGINVATLPWCLKNWQPGYRVLVLEFTKKDIAAIPVGDGKFRLRRAKVVGEKKIDPVALGLVRVEEKVAV